MSGIKDYSTTPSNNNAAPPNGFPEGMAPASLNDGMRQVMADIRSWYQDPVWIDLGDTPTYSSGTVFLLTGDKTATYAVGTRIRATGTTPFTVYGTITTSTFSSPNTSVTVTWDSVSMDSTLATVALNFTQASIERLVLDTTLTMSGAAINTAKGADIASATTTDIGAATGNYVVITGTTTITGFGTVQAGTVRIIRFSGALTLTHNATSLILPDGADITTTAGDCAIFVSEGSGNWRCVYYSRPSTRTPTFQYLSSGTTYTTPANCKAILVEMAGAGGGGGGYSSGAGSDGGSTSFNSIVANGGKGGNIGFTGTGAVGQGGTGGTGTATERFSGNNGAGGSSYIGGNGGAHPFFGGAGFAGDTSGTGATAGTRGGGGAGAGTGANAQPGGKGGGSGEAVRIYIENPSASYTYAIGSGGAAGTNATAGGNGYIRVTEYY